MILALVFLIGLCVGSFLNVVIYRLPRGRSLVSPSSRCGTCRSAISAWRNLPLFGYVISHGRCGKCGAAFSFRYFFVEFLTGVMFVAIFSIHGMTETAAIYALFSAVLIAGSFIDMELRIIPDALTIGAWGVFLALAALSPGVFPESLGQSCLGSAIGFGLFFILSRAYYWMTGDEGLGFGDVKLMGLIGAVTGVKGVLTATFVGSVLGAAIGLILMLVLKKGRRFPIPFGPFLSVGALASVFQLDLWWWIRG